MGSSLARGLSDIVKVLQCCPARENNSRQDRKAQREHSKLHNAAQQQFSRRTRRDTGAVSRRGSGL